MKVSKVFIWFCVLSFSGSLAYAQMPRNESVEGATVYIVSPANGETVSNPVKIVFGLDGMGVAPAGIDYPDSGHHHLLIDAELPENMGLPIPSDDNHRHFGKGQTEITLELSPGTHTLQLVFADMNHVPHDPPVVSEKITITVK